jgi:hypothetical protein
MIHATPPERRSEFAREIGSIKRSHAREAADRWNPQTPKAAARDALKTYDQVTGAVGKYTVGLPRTLLGKTLGVRNMKGKKKKADPLRRIAVAEASGRRNPEQDAAEMYEKFHGKPSEGHITVKEEIHDHTHLAALGVAVNLKLQTLSGYEATIELSKGAEPGIDETKADPKAVYLATNEDGTQLYLEGGDQGVDLKALHMDGAWERDDMILGPLFELTYRTRKDFDKFEVVDYYHELGEETGDLPLLRYEPRSPHLYISGGKYKIKKPLVRTSPGIEN